MECKRDYKKFGWQSGLTLVETLVTLLITSIAIYGAFAALSGVMLHYRQAELKQRVLHYGNYVIRDIMDNLNLADGRQPLIIDEWNGFSRIRFSTAGQKGRKSVLYTADEEEGVQRVLSPGEDKFITFPGTDTDISNIRIIIEEFKCSLLPRSSAYSRVFSDSFVDVYLEIKIEYMDQDKISHAISLPFHRRTFVPSIYKYEKV